MTVLTQPKCRYICIEFFWNFLDNTLVQLIIDPKMNVSNIMNTGFKNNLRRFDAFDPK
jgi:hypothetical protein